MKAGGFLTQVFREATLPCVFGSFRKDRSLLANLMLGRKIPGQERY